MTGVGDARAAYASLFSTTDPRPSRFADDGEAYRAWAGRADAWAADEVARIGREFPTRDRRGNVTGFYVYARGVNARSVAGPFATQAEAEAERKGVATMEALDIVCAHVFTGWGTIVREGAAA